MSAYAGFDGWIVQIDPPAVAINRTMLDLNNGVLSIGAAGGGAAIDWGTSQITEYLAQQGKYGSTVADFVIPNRTITIPLGIGMDLTGADSEQALRDLAMKVGLLFREGGWLLRQRYDASTGSYSDPMYADIVSATLDVPDAWLESGGIETGVTLTLECLPDFYGASVTLDELSGTGYVDGVLTVGGETAVIPGDFPARCSISTSAGASQYSAFWGFRSRHYASSAGAALYVPASNSDFATNTAATTLSGSISSSVLESTVGEAGFATLTGRELVGTYAVWLRAQVSATVQINCQCAQLAPTAGATFGSPGNWETHNLGTVIIPQSPSGAPGTFTILFNASNTTAITVYVDSVFFEPLDESAAQAGVASSLPAVCPSQISTVGLYSTPATSGSFSPLIPVYGDLPRIPPSGMENRPCEFLFKASRNNMLDPAGESDPNVDSLSATITYQPCYLVRI